MTNKTQAALCALALTSIAPAHAVAADQPRQARVERNSVKIMPFDMRRSMHVFRPTPSGGVQTVFVHDGDPRQVALVRSHLRREAAAFARGDFTDPASIHGGSMPGLREMHAGAKRIAVRYTDVPNGAAITYATSEPVLVAAIHAWFKAQVSDHGSHATMKM